MKIHFSQLITPNRSLLFLCLLLWDFTGISQTAITPGKKNEDIKVISKTDSLEFVLKKENLHDTVRINTLSVLSIVYTHASDYEKALLNAREAQKIASRINYKKGLANSYLCFGNIDFRTSKFDEALKNYSAAIKLFTEMKSKGGVANCYLGSGSAHMYLANYPVALKCYTNALNLFKETDNKNGMASCYDGIGSIHIYLGNYPDALKNQLNGLKIREQIGDKRGMAASYNSIGMLYGQQKNNTEALENYVRSLELSKELGDKNSIGNSYNNIGTVYYGQGNYAEALKNYTSAVEIRNQIGDKKGMAASYNNIGLVFSETGNYHEALKKLFISLKITESISDKDGIIAADNNIGEVYSRKGEYFKAIIYFQKALELSKEIGAKEMIRAGYNLLAETCRKKKDYKSAFEYQQLHSQFKDSLLNEENSRQINRMKIEYETEKKEREIALLQKNNELKEKDIEVKRLTILGLTAGVTLLFISGFVFYQWNRSRQHKRLQEENLKHQKDQLMAVVHTQEEERKRIAKDLHDGVGQLLAGLKLNLENVSGDESVSTTGIKEKLKFSAKILDEAATEVRSMSHQMMPRVLHESGLVPAIEDLVGKTLNGSSIKYDFKHSDMTGRFSENLEIGLFRIVQELIGNILKHAHATEINIRLFKSSRQIILMVEDNGKGFNFDEKKNQGLGLMNIRSRAQLVKGEVIYSSGLDKGTIATIRIPV